MLKYYSCLGVLSQCLADVAELADALDSKSSEFTFVPVRVRPSAVHLSYAQIAQLVEQRTENPRVGGSIPSLGIHLCKTVWEALRESFLLYRDLLGDNCVIGAHSPVNKDIPPNSVAVGAPCKVIRTV